jgi:hypothetical protein
LIKTLINLTPAGFIGAAIPTLWRTLARANYQDVAQLTGNRNGGQIILTLLDADISKVIDRTCGEIEWPTPKAKRDYIARLKDAATNRGWMKCISKALRRAVRQAAEEQAPITPIHLEAALLEELADRGVKPLKDAA